MEEKFSVVKRGYDPEEVNKYIGGLEDVIQSYKEKDNAIKNAIISAQLAADNILKNAELEAEKTVKDAAAMLKDLSESIERQRGLLTQFQDDYKRMMDKYLHKVDAEDFKRLNGKIDALQDVISNTRQYTSAAEAQPEAAEAPESE